MRAERELRGWTQSDLAKHLEDRGLKLHPSAIAKIEQRDVERPRAIRLDEAEAIAQVLGVTVDEMSETDEFRLRYLGNRMRSWLARLGDTLEDGDGLCAELLSLLDSASDDERGQLQDTLLAPEFLEFVAGARDRAAGLLSRLRHPSRNTALDWSTLDSDDPSWR